MPYIIAIAVALVFGLLTAHFARVKNREPVVWGILGTVAPLLALIVLAFHNCLCHRCKNSVTQGEARTGRCPHCDPSSQGEAEVTALDLAQKWRLEPRRIDDCRGSFTVEAEKGQPFADYLVGFFEAHRDPSLGRFCTAELSSSQDGERWQLLSSVEFAPFEQGMTQEVEITVAPRFPALVVELSIRRTGGDALRWWEHNHSFMNALRRAIVRYQASVH